MIIRDLIYKDGTLNRRALIVVCVIVAIILICIVATVTRGGTSAPEISGKYEIENIEEAGDGMDSDVIEQMKMQGLTITLDVKDDGTAVMDMFGQTMEITYDTREMRMTIDGRDVPFSYEKNKLKIEQDDTAMTFIKTT